MRFRRGEIKFRWYLGMMFAVRAVALSSNRWVDFDQIWGGGNTLIKLNWFLWQVLLKDICRRLNVIVELVTSD